MAQPDVPSANRIIRFAGSLPAAAASVQPLRFAVYDQESGGALLWEEIQTATVDTSGNYSVFLGNTSPDGLPLALFADGAPRWLSVERAGVPVGSRVLLAAVPYAVSAATAANASTLGGRPATDYLLTPKARAAASASAAGATDRETDPLVNNGTANFIGKFFNNVDLINSQLFDNGTNVGVGTTTPVDKFQVQFTNTVGTATGLAVRNLGNTATSYSGMLFYDHTGALRQFQGYNNSTGEYRINNISPTPSINFMTGSTSRFLVNSSGNIGVGETSPGYKLDVLHGGSTGIRVRSSSSFSVLDIDAASGDAALRFQKAGVNQWNIRNRPADDYLEIFELGGGGSRVVIQDATGNVGIGETTSPSYKLDVLHGGSTGVRVRSSSSFSVVDIDAQSGDAALRFANNGVNQWNIRNNPGTDDLQFFELGGGGERMRIENTTGRVVVNGAFTALGAKAFTIEHPLDSQKTLSHAAIESPEVLNLYRGNVTTDGNGKAVVQLPAYYGAINKDPSYFLTVIGAFAQAIVSREISGNSFEIATNQPNVKVSWEVKATRNDAYMIAHPFEVERAKPITTSSTGSIAAEPRK